MVFSYGYQPKGGLMHPGWQSAQLRVAPSLRGLGDHWSESDHDQIAGTAYSYHPSDHHRWSAPGRVAVQLQRSDRWTVEAKGAAVAGWL